eukprot:EG_transcript_6708
MSGLHGHVGGALPENDAAERLAAESPSDSHACRGGGGQSVFVAWTMCVNLLVGACLLNVPNAFARAGIPFSVAFLALATAACYATAGYLIETQSRAAALLSSLQQMTGGLPHNPLPGIADAMDAPSAACVDVEPDEASLPATPTGEDLVSYAARCVVADAARRLAGEPIRHFPQEPPPAEDFVVADRVLEVNQLCRIFLGQTGQHVWEACVIAWVYICLWLYLAIMAQTVLAAVPLPGLTSHGQCDVYQAAPLSAQCDVAYRVWLVVVWALMLPAVLLDLRDLGSLQLALNALVYVVVGTMVATVWMALLRAPYDPTAGGRAAPPFVAPQQAFSADGFSLLFSATVFGQMGHIGVPSITSVLKDKSQAKRVWLLGFLTNAGLQALLAVSCVLYFGTHTSPISTLNWKDYTAGRPPAEAPGWAAAVSWLVVMMPVVTISAGYPLQSAALASNLLHAIPRRAWAALCGSAPVKQADEALDPLLDGATTADSWPPTRVKVVAKLLTVGPPLLPALLVRDAAKITRLGGLVGFLLSLLIPCILQWRSSSTLQALWPRVPDVARTPYSSAISGKFCVAAVLGVSVVAFAYSAWDTGRRLLG